MADQNESSHEDTRWWIATGDKPEGPHTRSYIEMLLRSGRIVSTNLACPVDGEEWKPLCEWPELSDLAAVSGSQNAPPPLPVPTVLPRHIGLLTNPRLPRMANWICIYCIAVYPVLNLLSCIETFAYGTASDFQYDSPATGFAVTYDAIMLVLYLGTAIAIVIGGLHLRRLRRVGATVIKAFFIVDFASIVIELLTATLWSALAAVVASPLPAEEELTALGGVLVLVCLLIVALFVAVLVFQIIAFIWLLRHEHELPLNGRET